LPKRMRTLGPNTDTEGAPRITYPPADARLELGLRESISLAALGGGKLHWLIDGKPIEGTRWTPQGAGEARVAVVDEAGRSSAVIVHITERR
jgi:penicillin-binding protein 1C